MKLLIIGHEGYVGAALVSFFERSGHEVRGWGSRDDLLAITREKIEGTEIVVNCATAADRVNTRYQLEGQDERVNVLGVRQLALALRGTGAKLVHLSTKDIYGDVYQERDVIEEPTRFVPRFEIDDEQPFRPQTVYAKTKLIGELLAESHAETNIVRLSSCYTSEAHKRGNWVLAFCRKAAAGRPVELTGKGKQLRDLLHADDLGKLILKMASVNRWGFKLNAGGGGANAFSILEVLNRINPSLGREFTPGGDFGFVASNRVAAEVFGWHPSISFPEELKRIQAAVALEGKSV